MDADNSEIKPPFGPPDVPWRAVLPGAALHEGAVKCGQHHGETAYPGRVRHNGEILIGTAVPSAGICYIAKDGNVAELKEFEILTVDCGDPLIWENTSGTNLSSKAVKSGRAKDQEILYVGRHVEGENTYIGWVHPTEGRLHVNQEGGEKVFEDYELLVHKFLDRLCICPPCYRPPCAPPLE